MTQVLKHTSVIGSHNLKVLRYLDLKLYKTRNVSEKHELLRLGLSQIGKATKVEITILMKKIVCLISY